MQRKQFLLSEAVVQPNNPFDVSSVRKDIKANNFHQKKESFDYPSSGYCTTRRPTKDEAEKPEPIYKLSIRPVDDESSLVTLKSEGMHKRSLTTSNMASKESNIKVEYSKEKSQKTFQINIQKTNVVEEEEDIKPTSTRRGNSRTKSHEGNIPMTLKKINISKATANFPKIQFPTKTLLSFSVRSLGKSKGFTSPKFALNNAFKFSIPKNFFTLPDDNPEQKKKALTERTRNEENEEKPKSPKRKNNSGTHKKNNSLYQLVSAADEDLKQKTNPDFEQVLSLDHKAFEQLTTQSKFSIKIPQDNNKRKLNSRNLSLTSRNKSYNALETAAFLGDRLKSQEKNLTEQELKQLRKINQMQSEDEDLHSPVRINSPQKKPLLKSKPKKDYKDELNVPDRFRTYDLRQLMAPKTSYSYSRLLNNIYSKETPEDILIASTIRIQELRKKREEMRKQHLENKSETSRSLQRKNLYPIKTNLNEEDKFFPTQRALSTKIVEPSAHPLFSTFYRIKGRVDSFS